MKVMGANIFGHNAARLVPDSKPDDLMKLPAAAIRWVLQDPRVAMLNIGVSAPADIDSNLETLRRDSRFTNEDRQLLASFSARAYDALTARGVNVV